jgi:hypothetical protein
MSRALPCRLLFSGYRVSFQGVKRPGLDFDNSPLSSDGPGIESRWGEIFRCPDWPWGPPSLLYNGYRVFSGDQMRLGRAVDHSCPSNAAVKKG